MLYFIIRNILAVLLLFLVTAILASTIVEAKIEATESDFTSMLDEINRKLQASAEEYRQLVEQVKQREDRKDHITEIQTTDQQSSLVEQILSGYDKVNQSIDKQKQCNSNMKDEFRVFISFSMPEELIKNYDHIARQIGAKLILRGLINNSFKETILYIKQAHEQGMSIDIDPRAFEAFQVNQVPSFVINDGPHYDKLDGSVSIIYTLKQFAASGATQIKAQKYLAKLNEVEEIQQ